MCPEPPLAPASKDHLLQRGTGPTQQAYLDLTSGARHQAVYCPDLIWGACQIPEYARAVLRSVADLHQLPDDIEAGLDARLARARYLGEAYRTHDVLLGEQALLTAIEPAVMRAQLRHLLEVLDRPGLTVTVIPARARLRVYPGGGFTIYDGSRVETEGYAGPHTITGPDGVTLFQRAFDLLRDSAQGAPAARDFITCALRLI
ncbi:DUF5753 domain-containing protein [Kitasatospora sp. NBC_01287]|uniref:DUF5753 domain-containing protein n=1 Tax=Kitasatospora sp. NBC_01287 TaxID=2903573 RepID=UPI0022593AEB|nr:DUF5753 domain-containing protein [Kitasatospora sp. NBC_01287]MCX4751159.1 DUF5753 domain-containing protein [Kitasatospora sp. NBC_01287]